MSNCLQVGGEQLHTPEGGLHSSSQFETNQQQQQKRFFKEQQIRLYKKKRKKERGKCCLEVPPET